MECWLILLPTPMMLPPTIVGASCRAAPLGFSMGSLAGSSGWPLASKPFTRPLAGALLLPKLLGLPKPLPLLLVFPNDPVFGEPKELEFDAELPGRPGVPKPPALLPATVEAAVPNPPAPCICDGSGGLRLPISWPAGPTYINRQLPSSLFMGSL